MRKPFGLKILSLYFTAVFALGLASSTSHGAAPICSAVFVADQAVKNTDYLKSSRWGINLPDKLQSYIKKEVYLSESQSAEERFMTLSGFSLADLVVAPGHKILRVSSPSAKAEVPTTEAKMILLNAITDANGRVLFVDAWDGHHRILGSFQKGVQRLSDLKNAGFEISILMNGKPVGETEPWYHILPSAASNPSWQSRAIGINEKDVKVSGKYSNYEMGSRTTLAQLALNEAHARKSKIGIFFGTFDPVHENHIAVAKHAQEEFALDRVILIPNALPQHKKPTTLGLRQALLVERVNGEAALDTALFDTNYYIENFGKDVLIEKIRQDLGTNNVYLIDGGDSFIKLLSLNQIQPNEVTNYIVNKRGEDIQVPEHLKNKVLVSKADLEGLSSSDIRKEFSQGLIPHTTKFTKKSTNLIKAWGLYGTTAPKLYSSEQLYSFMKSSVPVADLQFKGGEASLKHGLTYHNNDVWQVLLPAAKQIDYQVAFVKVETEVSKQNKNNLNAEEAAFLLNRQLGMDIVPPAVLTKNLQVGGAGYEKAILSYAVTGAEKLLAPQHLNDSLEQKLFFSDARVLNVLLHNKDANDRNFLIGRHWKTGKQQPFLIDFSQSLQKDQYLSMTYYPTGHTAEIKTFRKSTFESLKGLTEVSLKKSLGHLLSPSEIQDILQRRDGIVAYVNGLIQIQKEGVLF